jgi:hypothetical protein
MEQIPKPIASSDRGLQLDLLKPESLVIVGQPYYGEYVLKPCTHRPSHQGNWEYLKFQLAWNNGKLNDRDEVVTRHG